MLSLLLSLGHFVTSSPDKWARDSPPSPEISLLPPLSDTSWGGWCIRRLTVLTSHTDWDLGNKLSLISGAGAEKSWDITEECDQWFIISWLTQDNVDSQSQSKGSNYLSLFIRNRESPHCSKSDWGGNNLPTAGLYYSRIWKKWKSWGYVTALSEVSCMAWPVCHADQA